MNSEELLTTRKACKWYTYLNKYVNIRLKPDVFESESRIKELNGWVFTIDPVNETVVLVNIENESEKNGQITLVFKDNIEHIEIKSNDENKAINTNIESLFKSTAPQTKMTRSKEDLIESRNQLINWLEKNRLPVKLENLPDTGEENNKLLINILDMVYIHPPYDIENCMSTNEIVLNRVKYIMKNFNK